MKLTEETHRLLIEILNREIDKQKDNDKAVKIAIALGEIDAIGTY